jgi:type IX secretion system PorP/SprF family membrane protein
MYTVKAQQFPSFTQYMLNKFITNPASAGVDGYTTVNFLSNMQWVGTGGTPKTFLFSIDSRILGDSYILQKLPVRKNEKPRTRSGNTAWGAYVINDANGPISKTYINGTYAYHLDLGERQISFGLSAMMFQNRIDGDQLITDDGVVDPLFEEGKQSTWLMDANFGIYYTTRDYYIGYSTIQLFNSGAQFGNDNSGEYKLNRQHNLSGGYRFGINNRIEVEPAFLLKIPETYGAQFDLSTRIIIDKRYWTGLNFKTGSALAIFGGLNYDKYYFGYAFEYYNNSFAQNTLGSHEITIIARFGDAARRYKWLNTY